MGPYSGHGLRASIRPPPCRPEEGSATGLCLRSKWKGRGGSTAGGRRCMRPLGPSANFSIRSFCRCGVALAATAERSTPPVTAPAVFLLPSMDIPFMAAPPPSRRGADSGTFLDPCVRGIRETIPLKSPKNHFGPVISRPRRAPIRRRHPAATGRMAGAAKVFQRLEKSFPMVGKNRPNFPMIGKIFRQFSNDWKKFSREGSGRDSSHKGHKGHRGKVAEGKREGAGKALGARASRPRSNEWIAGGFALSRAGAACHTADTRVPWTRNFSKIRFSTAPTKCRGSIGKPARTTARRGTRRPSSLRSPTLIDLPCIA